MKIVLRQDVPKLGESGSVQNVATGYARNFLIPQGMAVVATAGELKVASHNQAVQERKIVKQEQQHQALADRIGGQRLEFTARSGAQGRLYGSITAGDVADRLTQAVGEEIDRRKVVLDDAIRSVGEHRVTVHLVGRLRPQVTVIVHGESDEEEPVVAADDAVGADDAGEETESEGVVSEQSAERPGKRGKGRSGHPEPGSEHDDTKTETTAEGPAVAPVDGVPGAYGEVETEGGATTETEVEGKAVKVADEMGT
ncbi:MAG: 50S ribosomal protein L9 [Solirubrobacterales bacterium]|nr:50S ribosomal protein L9 [Solirubrobacterales bacterium]